jgi:predicted Fe-S protein YdhL (DUF1289 family)
MKVDQNAMKRLAHYAALARATAKSVPSPCISVCRMDEQGTLCQGCLRSIDEIRLWSSSTDVQKRAVWALIEQRIATHAPGLAYESDPAIHTTP